MKTLVASCLLSVFGCAAVWAQATAQIHGAVQDSSGSAVPGAEVKAIQTEKGISRAVTSSENGGYVLTNLPLGPYRLEVTKDGFTTFVQSGIVLEVNSDPTVDPILKVGSVTERVIVEANATAVETRSSGIGEVVQTQRIVELPLNGRNTTDLITLAGNAVNVGTTANNWFSNLPEIAISGGAYFATAYSLDGVNHFNYLSGTTMPVAFPDAVQEFRVESSGQSAQRGATTSVSIVTRSGSNDIHGNLFEFLRNSGFGSAREYFSKSVNVLKRNQFGGTVGGPIKKNKLFYFGGFEGTTLRSIPSFGSTKVPTAAMLAGNWSVFEGPSCNKGTLKGPFSNNQISPSLYSKPALFFVNKVLGNLNGITPDQCGNVTYPQYANENDSQYVGKTDYQLNDKQSLFFRALITRTTLPVETIEQTNIFSPGVGGVSELAQSYGIGHTDIFSPTLVNSFSVGFNRTATTGLTYPQFSFCDAGVQIYCPYDALSSSAISINGGFSLQGLPAPNTWRMTSYAVNDDINWVKGNHQMTFGAGGLWASYAQVNFFAAAGQFTFSGATTGNGMADFFLGVPAQFLQGLSNNADTSQNNVNIYFADSWKINSHLTFNFGIRWEPLLPMTVPNGQISNFDMTRFLDNVKSTVFVNAPPGFYFPGDPGFPGKSGYYHQWNHFDPRGGIAWDPKGDGKTSVRASYAFGYAYIPGVFRQDAAGSNPWGGRSNYSVTNFTNPFSNTPGGNPYPYTVNQNVIFTPGGQFLTQPYNLGVPTTYSWNVAVQHQLGNSWIASATYIGSRVQHLYVNVALNYGTVVGPILASGCAVTATNCTAVGNLQVRRVLSVLNPAAGVFVGNLTQWDPSGYQNYNAGLFTLQKRFSKGVSVNANWTWSHCIGVFQGYESKPDETATVPNNPNFDRGNCDSDRRNIVNITAVAQTPKFSNHALRLLGTGWQLAGIYRFSSGMPLSIQEGSGVDQELTGINHQRPNLVQPNSVYTGHDGPGVPYLNLSAFALPALGTIGNLGWNSIVSPNSWGLDMALSRKFPITERQNLEIRADAFNITNSFVTLASGFSTANPASSSVPAYASITAGSNFGVNNSFAAPTRKIQFAMKYTF